MGGMALGAWLVTKMLKAHHNLLILYALVELLIGVMGFLFHGVFQWIIDLSFNVIIPTLQSSGLALAYKWILGGIIILPQSILLGTTFPLMTNGLLRLKPDLPGRSISLLYFGNSIGAAIGVLVSGFFLIGAVGIPGTIMFAGILNILIAIIVYRITRGQAIETTDEVGSVIPARIIPRLILWASFLTGSASFIYELVWVRMLSMVLGSSTHAFELMLSAFITGLAFGGLWVRKRIDKLGNLLHFGALIQIIMGLLAVSTLILYDSTFDIMAMLLLALDTNSEAYALFNLGSHAIALLVMLPTTFLAGMTLPVFTLILLRNNYGEQSVSHIYVSNMAGAIAGIVFVTFIGMPLLGLKGTLIFGGGIDLLLGYVMLHQTGIKLTKFKYVPVSLLVFIFIMFNADLDPRRMSSSVFRVGRSIQPDDIEVVFHQDGKTSTITVLRDTHGMQTIYTNGKPDASVYMGSELHSSGTWDEITQVLLAALPLAIHPDARLVANIGMGSGMTSQTALLWPGIERLDTIEIESEMVKGAAAFRPRSELVFTDPRSFIHLEDARSFLSLSKNKYDLIISEPSNPWVSGVSSLYTDEFYGQISRSLEDDGYLVQWLHLYEINKTLFYSVLKAMSDNFNDYHIYATNNFDILIVARLKGRISNINSRIFEHEEMRSTLSNVSINSIQDFDIRYLANKQLLEPILQVAPVAENSDFFPYLDLYAPRARFMGESVTMLIDLKMSPLPVSRFLGLSEDVSETRVSLFNEYVYTQNADNAMNLLGYVKGDVNKMNLLKPVDLANIEYLIRSTGDCRYTENDDQWIQQFFSFIKLTQPYLGSREMIDILEVLKSDCDSNNSAKAIWVRLMLEMNNGAYSKWIQTARELSDQTSPSLTEQHRYLLELNLLALYLQERDDEFVRVFKGVTQSLDSDQAVPYELELLLGQILMRQ
jgi:spermidine synthase